MGGLRDVLRAIAALGDDDLKARRLVHAARQPLGASSRGMRVGHCRVTRTWSAPGIKAMTYVEIAACASGCFRLPIDCALEPPRSVVDRELHDVGEARHVANARMQRLVLH
jgi:hypothetical protein